MGVGPLIYNEGTNRVKNELARYLQSSFLRMLATFLLPLTP